MLLSLNKIIIIIIKYNVVVTKYNYNVHNVVVNNYNGIITIITIMSNRYNNYNIITNMLITDAPYLKHSEQQGRCKQPQGAQTTKSG
jgi:hypothetical protein